MWGRELLHRGGPAGGRACADHRSAHPRGYKSTPLAERYERDLTDILFLQSDVAEAIAQQIYLVAAPGDRHARRSLRPVDPVAHELYLRGRYAALDRTQAWLEEASRHYHHAIARDSAFALAYAGLADTHELLGGNGFRPLGPAVDTARVLAEHVLALDPTLSEAHNSLAGVLTDLVVCQRALASASRLVRSAHAILEQLSHPH